MDEKHSAEPAADESEDLLREIRRGKLAALRERGLNPFANDFQRDTWAAELHRQFPTAPAEKPEGTHVLDERSRRVAGRVMALRSFGKAAFLSLLDRTGTIQIYVRKDVVGEDAFWLFKHVEVGDHVGAAGLPFFTKTGELTLEVRELRLLTKALRPLPEKWHGLRDVETRYRQRYLDLVANPEVREVFRARALIITEIRRYLDEAGFLEVETPMMHHIPGGAAARPFITHHNALDMDLYMRIAPELFLKRLLVGGLERVYELGRQFRNEGVSTRHNPEFTMLEFYEAYATHRSLMVRTEELIERVALELDRQFPQFKEKRAFRIERPFKRLSLEDAVRDHLSKQGLGLDVLEDGAAFAAWLGRRKPAGPDAPKKGAPLPQTRAARLMFLFETLVEPELGPEPVFILDHPIEVSPLSRRNDAQPELAERFELYLGGQELINAFSELNDPDDQAERFRRQAAARAAGDEEAMAYDEDYITALEHGMPPAGGWGMGIDRLVMHLCGVPSIRDVILFPLLKPAG